MDSERPTRQENFIQTPEDPTLFRMLRLRTILRWMIEEDLNALMALHDDGIADVAPDGMIQLETRLSIPWTSQELVEMTLDMLFWAGHKMYLRMHMMIDMIDHAGMDLQDFGGYSHIMCIDQLQRLFNIEHMDLTLFIDAQHQPPAQTESNDDDGDATEAAIVG